MILWNVLIIANIDAVRLNKETHQKLYKSPLLVNQNPESMCSQNIVSAVQLIRNPVCVVSDVHCYTEMSIFFLFFSQSPEMAEKNGELTKRFE